MQCLVKHGADVDLKADSGLDSGRTPLHTAALVGARDIAEFLLKHGAGVNNQDASGHTPLHLAASEGHVTTVACFIDAGGNGDLQDVAGKTALHLCFNEKDEPTESQKQAAMLLEPSTNLNLVDHKGRTALHMAALWDCDDIIELMLTRDVDVNVRDSEGNTPLHYAFLNEVDINMAAARVLLGHGVDLQLMDGTRKSPIHALMKHRRSSDPDVKEMVREWANIKLSAEFGSSLLHLATIGGNTDVARFLLACGVDPNMADNQGKCPLHLAAIGGRLDLLRVLLKNGAKVDTQDGEGATALHYAAELPRVTAVKMLLREKPPLEMEDNFGYRPLHRACGWGVLDTVKQLVSSGVELNAQSKEGLQPLHLAAKEDKEEVAEFLMSKGAEVMAKDEDGNTPLHLAAIKGNCDLLKALYVNSADINDVNNNKQTALHLACYHGNADSVQTLLNRGANATLRDVNNKKPEEVAIEEGHDKVTRVLRNFKKTVVRYAQDQLPLVADSPEELLDLYPKRNPRLNCLRPLVSIETLLDEEELEDEDLTERIDQAGDCERTKLLDVLCVSTPQDEIELEVVNDRKSDKGEARGGRSKRNCCKVS